VHKSYSTPSDTSRVFLPELSFFDGKTSEALGTHHLQATVTMFFKCLRQRSNGLKNYACQQYFTCMCFLGFVRYNKTFIACGFRKYGNLFIFPSPTSNKCIMSVMSTTMAVTLTTMSVTLTIIPVMLRKYQSRGR
jgi:hypothetical protein